MKNKKNLIYKIILIIIVLFSYNANVLAAASIVDRRAITIDGQQVYKIYDNTETGTIDYLSTGHAGRIILEIDGEEKSGFCVDFEKNIYMGVADFHTIKEHFTHVLGEAEAEELTKKLIEYVRFGYGTEGKTSDKYYLATQELIWETISDTGFYASDYYVQASGGTLNKIRIKNFRWVINNGQTVINVDDEINAIKTSINNYYKTPSFCSNQQKLEIEVGTTTEYIDSNNVLSKFELNCDGGIECQKDGNKLKITPINEAGSNNIRFEKKDTKGTDGYIYKHENGQGVIVESGTLEQVSCDFGVNSFKNEQTSDMKIVYVITIGLFCGVMAYIAYCNKNLYMY